MGTMNVAAGPGAAGDAANAGLPAAIAIPSRRFTAEDMDAYAALTGDFNPIHCDPAFAAGTRFGRPIAFGTLVLATIWTRLEEVFGPDALRSGEASVRFLKPVLVGTSVTIDGRLEAWDAGDGRCRYHFTVRTEAGETAAVVEVGMRRAGRPPEGGAR